MNTIACHRVLRSPLSTTPRDIRHLRRRFWLACVLGLAVGPRILSAHDLQLGVDSRYLYYSDLLSLGTARQPEHGLELEQRARLSHVARDWRYRVSYAGNYQRYFERTEFNALEHRLHARTERRLGPRTRINAEDRFRDISNLRFSLFDLEAGDNAFGPTQQRYLANDLAVAVTHELSPRLSWRTELQHQLVAFLETEERSDGRATTAAAELGYRLTPRITVGLEANGGRQHFDPTLLRTGSDADLFGMNFVFETQLDRQSTLSMRWGPALIRTRDRRPAAIETVPLVGRTNGGQVFLSAFVDCTVDARTGRRLATACDPADASSGLAAPAGLGEAVNLRVANFSDAGSTDALTHFGHVRYAGAHLDWTWSAAYERRLTTTAGNALASSLDRFALALDYVPTGAAWRWYSVGRIDLRRSLTSGLSIDFTLTREPDGSARRDSALLRRVNDADALDNLTVVTGLEHAFSRSTRSAFEFRYFDSAQRNANARNDPPSRYLFALILSHDFDPMRLF